MSTLAKIFVSTLVSLMMLSCVDMNYGPGIDGNGNVIDKERKINSQFNAIEVSRGIDLYLSQGEAVSLSVEADKNLHEIIITEVEGNVLKVYADDNIRRSKSQAVYLSFKDISSIEATSGSHVYGETDIRANNLSLKTTSGADMQLSINADKVFCKATSGSDLVVSGAADYLNAEATSGSDINAKNLKTLRCEANATSGADIAVFTTDELMAKASSGGDVRYYGSPKKVDKSDGVSGSVSKQ